MVFLFVSRPTLDAEGSVVSDGDEENPKLVKKKSSIFELKMFKKDSSAKTKNVKKGKKFDSNYVKGTMKPGTSLLRWNWKNGKLVGGSIV